MVRFLGKVAVLAAIFLLCVAEGRANWQSAGALNIPKHSYSFLSAGPSGDLLAVTFNNSPANTAPVNLPALLIRNPTTANPQVIELSKTMFESQRGYSGVAADDKGAFYVSGDTGNASTCFIKKFDMNGNPAEQFGRNGTVRPNRRVLGIEVMGNYVFALVDWGEAIVFDATTGVTVGNVPKSNPSMFVRDIAIDPESMRT